MAAAMLLRKSHQNTALTLWHMRQFAQVCIQVMSTQMQIGVMLLDFRELLCEERRRALRERGNGRYGGVGQITLRPRKFCSNEQRNQ